MKKQSLAGALSLALVSTALLLSPAQAQNITTVNGKAVPKARAETLMSQAVKAGQQRTPELEAQVNDEVVMREIFMQEAEKRGRGAAPADNAQMELARQAILIRDLFADYQKKNPVTDAEIQTEYDKYKAQAGGTEYRASHILVEKEEDAKSLIAQIKGGAKFEDVAKKNSKDPGSAEKGGDLDWANPGSYVPEFSQAMTKLQKGQMTETPVKSQFGWHIIRLDDTRAAQVPPLAEVKGQIQQRLGQMKLAKFRDELRAKAKTDYKFSQ
jgi:peptidyl-prolyl cis-trans isomerase C